MSVAKPPARTTDAPFQPYRLGAWRLPNQNQRGGRAHDIPHLNVTCGGGAMR